ncbi:MAG: leucine-rich repeat protein [Oscillospiraceae bacterium]|jgi:hypothetical protein|nr:leucine-rich repeat protein [Oscillospiraceae bacterium]
MKQKTLSLLLSLFLLLSLLPATAQAAEEEFVIKDGVLTEYNGPGGDVVIPDGVIEIPREVFNGNKDITSLVIPDSVTDLDFRFLPTCDNLRSLTLGRGIRDFLSYDQRIPRGMRSITLRGDVSKVDYRSFRYCDDLQEINYSGAVEQWRSALREGMFPGVTTIGPYGTRYIPPYTAMQDIPNAVVHCSDGDYRDDGSDLGEPGGAGNSGNSGSSGSSGGTGDSGGTDGVRFTLTKDPDMDSFDLAECAYPAILTVIPSLTVDGVEVPASRYSVTYDWEMTNSNSPFSSTATTKDEVNYLEVSAYLVVKRISIYCTATAIYEGKRYTAEVVWPNLYRSNERPQEPTNKVCQVYLDLNGGTVDGQKQYPALERMVGEPVGTLPVPVRPNYTFQGWQSTAGGSDMVTASTPVPDLPTWGMRAQWKGNWENNSSAEDFEINSKGYLKKYVGPGGSVVIPPVTSIGTYAFFNCETLTDVVISDEVQNIGNQAFAYCANLRSVSIPGSVQKIDGYAFNGCTSLTEVVLPEGVKEIDFLAFNDCKNLTAAVIPASVTKISSSAFAGCPKLTIYGKAGSAAETFAREQNIPFSTGPAPSSDAAAPAAPAETIPASGTSYASTQTVTVDGKAVEFQMYALKDEKGNPTNYIKLRDLAQILSGTEAQFAVGYDNTAKAISVTTGEAYTPNGSEMQTPFSGDRSYTGGARSVTVDGEAVELTAITLTDDAGGGYTYFKLRDLGKVLGFNTGWTREQGVFVESDKPYTE